jgi:hypothetical protein
MQEPGRAARVTPDGRAERPGRQPRRAVRLPDVEDEDDSAPPAPAAEVVLASVHGGDPSKSSGIAVLGLVGGVIGGLIIAVGDKLSRDSTGVGLVSSRELRLTTTRCDVYDKGVLTGGCSVAAISGVRLKKAFSNMFRRVLSVRHTEGRDLKIEGSKKELEAFAATLAAHANLGGRGVRKESGFFLPKAFVLAVLLLISVPLLIAVPFSFADGHSSDAFQMLLIGGVLFAAAIGLWKLFFRR